MKDVPNRPTQLLALHMVAKVDGTAGQAAGVGVLVGVLAAHQEELAALQLPVEPSKYVPVPQPYSVATPLLQPHRRLLHGHTW